MRSRGWNGRFPGTYGATKRQQMKPKPKSWSAEKGFDMLLERLLDEIREEIQREREYGEAQSHAHSDDPSEEPASSA